MIYKWNEINYSTFKELFKEFRERVDYLKDKVIEIQEPLAIIDGDHMTRVYLSTNPAVLDLAKDCEDGQPFMKAFMTVCQIEKLQPKEILEKENAITCLAYDAGSKIPTIMPMFIGNEHCRAFLSIFFGDLNESTPLMEKMGEKPDNRTGYWYLKEKSGKRFIDLGNNAVDRWLGSDKKTVRIRTLDYVDWWKMVNGYKSDHCVLDQSDDLMEDDFELTGD